MQDHWLWENNKELSKMEAWIDILLNVNHSDKKILIGNELYDVKRGQSINSQLTWAKRWNWDRSRVRRFFKTLEKDKMVVLEPDTKTTILTVCKYDSYQDVRPSNEHQTNTNKNVKNNIEIIRVSNPPIGVSPLYFYIAKSYHNLFLKKGSTKSLRKAKLDKWVDEVRKIIELDKVKVEQLVAVKMYWELCEEGVERDRFWYDTVNSMASFRKKDKNDEYYFDKITQSVKKWLDRNPQYIQEVKSRYNNLMDKANGSSK